MEIRAGFNQYLLKPDQNHGLIDWERWWASQAFSYESSPPEKHVLSYKDHILDINKINAVLVKVFAKQHNWSNLYMYIILIW